MPAATSVVAPPLLPVDPALVQGLRDVEAEVVGEEPGHSGYSTATPVSQASCSELEVVLAPPAPQPRPQPHPHRQPLSGGGGGGGGDDGDDGDDGFGVRAMTGAGHEFAPQAQGQRQGQRQGQHQTPGTGLNEDEVLQQMEERVMKNLRLASLQREVESKSLDTLQDATWSALHTIGNVNVALAMEDPGGARTTPLRRHRRRHGSSNLRDTGTGTDIDAALEDITSHAQLLAQHCSRMLGSTQEAMARAAVVDGAPHSGSKEERGTGEVASWRHNFAVLLAQQTEVRTKGMHASFQAMEHAQQQFATLMLQRLRQVVAAWAREQRGTAEAVQAVCARAEEAMAHMQQRHGLGDLPRDAILPQLLDAENRSVLSTAARTAATATPAVASEAAADIVKRRRIDRLDAGIRASTQQRLALAQRRTKLLARCVPGVDDSGLRLRLQQLGAQERAVQRRLEHLVKLRRGAETPTRAAFMEPEPKRPRQAEQRLRKTFIHMARRLKRGWSAVVRKRNEAVRRLRRALRSKRKELVREFRDALVAGHALCLERGVAAQTGVSRAVAEHDGKVAPLMDALRLKMLVHGDKAEASRMEAQAAHALEAATCKRVEQHVVWVQRVLNRSMEACKGITTTTTSD